MIEKDFFVTEVNGFLKTSNGNMAVALLCAALLPFKQMLLLSEVACYLGHIDENWRRHRENRCRLLRRQLGRAFLGCYFFSELHHPPTYI